MLMHSSGKGRKMKKLHDCEFDKFIDPRRGEEMGTVSPQEESGEVRTEKSVKLGVSVLKVEAKEFIQ